MWIIYTMSDNNSFDGAQPMCGRKTTFDWKINFMKKTQYRSELFAIEGYKCHLVANYCFGITENFWLFSLDAPGIQYNSSFYPVYYTVSVVDLEGHDFIKNDKKLMGGIWEKAGTLTTIREKYLEENELIKKESIQLCFTFDRRKEATEDKQDLLLTECSTQVEASELQPSRDICTNTECSTQVEASELQPSRDICTNTECSTQVEASELQHSRDICTNTEEEPATLLETLSNDFCSFYESKTATDCVLRVNEEQFPVHRAVLSARSTVFSAMFHHDMAENRSGVVDIPDIKANALGDTLYYMYSGKSRGLTAETASAIYSVADKYALIELRKECLDFLRCNLTIDNVCDAALLAHTHGEADLEEKVSLFIENRLEDIMESNQWKEFSTIKPLLANRLLGSAFISCKKKLLASGKTLK